MCFANRSTAPMAQPAAPAPTRASVTAGAIADPVSLVEQSKQLMQKRQGIFGNLRTTPMGDASYGSFATFGPARRAA